MKAELTPIDRERILVAVTIVCIVMVPVNATGLAFMFGYREWVVPGWTGYGVAVVVFSFLNWLWRE